VCLWIGGTPRLCDRSGVFELAEAAGSPRFAGWIGVPTGTAAVVFTRGDEPVGWQSPVGGVVVIPITEANISALVAIDEAGRELNRLALPDGLGAASEVVVTTTTMP